jgi:hypothetical protein
LSHRASWTAGGAAAKSHDTLEPSAALLNYRGAAVIVCSTGAAKEQRRRATS